MINSRLKEAVRTLGLVMGCFCFAWHAAGAPATNGRSVPGENLFGGSSIRKFVIKVDESELTKLKQDNRKYVRATITDGQDVYKDVGIHLKGMGSFQPLDKKPSFVVKFDYEDPKQRYEGLS